MIGPFFVGIDCGSQSAKVTIFDRAGHIAASGQAMLQPMLRPRPGVVLHADDDLWTQIAAATKSALRSFDGNPDEIAAVGLCPIRCCKAFLRSDGSLAEPMMSWMDDRAYQPYVPDDATVHYVTTASGYLAHRFTGEFRDTAANNIALQWPIDTDTWEWSDDPDVLSRFGVRREMLFELQMPGDIVGGVTAEASAATGIPRGVPVVATANDKAVELLGAGELNETSALLSLGTYIAAMMPGQTHHADAAHFWTNFACVPHRYLYESNGVRRGMWTLTWFLDLLGPEIAERAAALGISREAYIEREAVGVPAGSDGLMTVLDWLAGADAPFRKGSMLGFDARHTRGHIYRSIMEAIALTMERNVAQMVDELNTELQELVVSGGGASSDLFMQILADVFAVPTSRATGATGAALGAAMCAAAAVGAYDSVEAASLHMSSPRESFTPGTAHSATYRQLGAHYHSIRGATDQVYQGTFSIVR